MTRETIVGYMIDELGLDEEEIDRLEAEGIIGTRPSFM